MAIAAMAREAVGIPGPTRQRSWYQVEIHGDQLDGPSAFFAQRGGRMHGRDPQRLVAAGVMSIDRLKLDPVWDPLRKDPRFQALLKTYAGAPSNATASGTSP